MRQLTICFYSQGSYTAFQNLGYVTKPSEIKISSECALPWRVGTTDSPPPASSPQNQSHYLTVSRGWQGKSAYLPHLFLTVLKSIVVCEIGHKETCVCVFICLFSLSSIIPSVRFPEQYS